MADTALTSATALEDADRRKAWGFVAPALLWTVAFFVVPFAFMAAMSLWKREGRDIVHAWTFDNYVRFFSENALFRGLVNSLEITVIVTVISVLLAYPLAWIIAERVPKRLQRMALFLAILPIWSC
jgi:spermidine/putrescine transport system permease protein